MQNETDFTFQELMECPCCGKKSLHCVKKGRILYYQCGSAKCRKAWTATTRDKNKYTSGFCGFLVCCLFLLVLAVLAT